MSISASIPMSGLVPGANPGCVRAAAADVGTVDWFLDIDTDAVSPNADRLDGRMRARIATTGFRATRSGPVRRPWTLWATLAAWTMLTTAALAALVALATVRRRRVPPPVDRGLTVTAWLACAGLLAWQTARFVLDMV